MRIRKVCHVPSDARVYHYDELDRELQYALPDLAQGSGCSIDRLLADSFVSNGDFIKFTEYYQVVQ